MLMDTKHQAKVDSACQELEDLSTESKEIKMQELYDAAEEEFGIL